MPRTRTRTYNHYYLFHRASAARRQKQSEHPRFAEFWAAYPLKAGVGDARKAFAKAMDAGHDPDVLIAAAGRYARHCQRTGKDRHYIKHGSGWLNGERWADDYVDEEVERPVANPHRRRTAGAATPPTAGSSCPTAATTAAPDCHPDNVRT